MKNNKSILASLSRSYKAIFDDLAKDIQEGIGKTGRIIFHEYWNFKMMFGLNLIRTKLSIYHEKEQFLAEYSKTKWVTSTF